MLKSGGGLYIKNFILHSYHKTSTKAKTYFLKYRGFKNIF